MKASCDPTACWIESLEAGWLFLVPSRDREGAVADTPSGWLLSVGAPAEALLGANRGHWGIDIMHRNKDAILGEDGYTNRSDNAPRNIFSLIGFAPKILKSVAHSPTRAIEQFQDHSNNALRLFSG